MMRFLIYSVFHFSLLISGNSYRNNFIRKRVGISTFSLRAATEKEQEVSNNVLSSSTGKDKILKTDSINRLFEDSLEEVENRILTFSKPLPSWLDGILVRNGPSCFGSVDGSEDRRTYSHVFDGLSRLTSYTFSKDSNTATFSAKFIKSQWYDTIVTQKGNIPASVTTAPADPPFTQFQTIMGAMKSGEFDNTPVHVHQIGGKGGVWVATTDAPVMMQFDPVNLDTIGMAKYRNKITSFGSVELFSTSHPKNDIDPLKQFTYNYFLEVSAFPLPFKKNTNIAHIAKTNLAFERTIIGSVELGPGAVPYIHDIVVTENYAILCVWPLFVNFAEMTNGKGFLPQMDFQGDSVHTKIYVFDLHRTDGDSSPIATYEAPPRFAYHFVNAYDDIDSVGNKKVVVDAAAYEDGSIANGEHGFAYIKNMKDPELRRKQVLEGRLTRFELPLSGERPSQPLKIDCSELLAITPQQIELRSEFCVINPQLRGRKYKYMYGAATRAGDGPDRGGYLDWALVKHDVHISHANIKERTSTASASVWKELNCFPSEPIFVASPSAASEDDGVLLSQVYDGTREESFLLVLDARTMTEISRSYLGIICPISFHGTFIPRE